MDGAQFLATCNELARRLATEINNTIAINPITLITTALLSAPRQTMVEKQLLTQIDILRAIARGMNYSDKVTVTNAPASEVLEQAMEITGVSHEQHAFSTTITATSELAAMLAYYRNNVASIYAIPSLIARFVLSERSTTITDVTDFLRRLYPYLSSEYFLPYEETTIASLCIETLLLLQHANLINADIRLSVGKVNAPEPTSAEFESLAYLAEIIEPTLERFYIVAMLLASAQQR